MALLIASSGKNSPIVYQSQRHDAVHDRSEISNNGRSVHEQLERDSWVFAVVFLDKVPCDEACDSDDEGCEDVAGAPRILLTTPSEGEDDDTAPWVSLTKGSGVRWWTYVMEGMKTRFPILLRIIVS